MEIRWHISPAPWYSIIGWNSTLPGLNPPCAPQYCFNSHAHFYSRESTIIQKFPAMSWVAGQLAAFLSGSWLFPYVTSTNADVIIDSSLPYIPYNHRGPVFPPLNASPTIPSPLPTPRRPPCPPSRPHQYQSSPSILPSDGSQIYFAKQCFFQVSLLSKSLHNEIPPHTGQNSHH